MNKCRVYLSGKVDNKQKLMIGESDVMQAMMDSGLYGWPVTVRFTSIEIDLTVNGVLEYRTEDRYSNSPPRIYIGGLDIYPVIENEQGSEAQLCLSLQGE
jgi:hypothetical protein